MMMCYGPKKALRIIFALIIINSISLFCYIFLNSLETDRGRGASFEGESFEGPVVQDKSRPGHNNDNVGNGLGLGLGLDLAQNIGRDSTVSYKHSKGKHQDNNSRNEIQIQQPPVKKGSRNGSALRVSSQKPWQLFQKGITKDYMYAADAPYMQDLLASLSSADIRKTHMFKGGSQVKLFFEFSDGNTALVKPMRMKRDDIYPYSSKHPFWLDPERHNAEIASFHLDRILNFRRTVPVAGRLINMTQEILQKCNDKELLDTFLRKDGNLCFIGKCVPWFCNDEHPICGVGDMMEVSVAQFLLVNPSSKYPVDDRAYPWSQGVKESKVWKDANICDKVLMDLQNGKHRMFLDLIDLAIFDFLIVNYDRHHYTLLSMFRNESFVTLLDNGKGFGNYRKDDVTFLAPVYQCCKVRQSTYYRLKELSQENSKLSTLMRSSMSHDAISPILSEKFLTALDRRLKKALEIIQTCFMDYSEESVLMGA